MIFWLHVRYDRPAIAIVLVPPGVLVPGSGESGHALALGELVERSGAAAGTRAVGGMLGVHVGGWLIADGDALLRSLGGAAVLRRQVMGGSGALLTEAAFERQVSTLRALVVLAPRKEIPVHAFENYILGSGEASTSLGINGVASLERSCVTRPRPMCRCWRCPPTPTVGPGAPTWAVCAHWWADCAATDRRRRQGRQSRA